MKLSTELKDFIIQKTDLKAEEIKPDLKLAEDIGFYGLDSIIIFEEFFIKFGITNFDDFDFDLHIAGGPDFAPKPFIWLKNLFIKQRRKYLRPDVSLGHLQRVIDLGKWFNER